MKIDLQSKKANILILVLVLALTLFCSVVYCRGGVFAGDEVFSLGFSNNTEDFLFMTHDVCESYSTDGWLDSDFFRSYLGVEKGNGFSFVSIYRNVRDDVHPPAFFMLLNAVTTIVGGKPSELPGDIINVMAALVMSFVLYQIGKKLFGNSLMAAIVPLLWIGSVGACDGIQYIRMYHTFSVIVVIEIYLSMLLLEGKKDTWLYVLIGLFSFVGTLTHYYFYVAFFFIAAYMTIWYLRNKSYREMAKYLGVLAGFEALSVLLWPYVIKHLLFSDRGEQALGNLKSGDLNYYAEHLKGFAGTYNEEIFNGMGQFIVPVLIIALIVCAFISKKKAEGEKKAFEKTATSMICLVGVTAVGYFLVLFKISYSYRWHYISPTYALIDILLAAAVVYIYRNSKKIVASATIVIAIILLIVRTGLLMGSNIEKSHMWVERDNAKNAIVANRQVFFIYDDWSDTIDNQSMYLMNADNICFIQSDEIDDTNWEELLDKCPGDTSEIVFMVSDYNQKADEEFERIIDNIQYDSGNCVWKDNYLVQLIYR